MKKMVIKTLNILINIVVIIFLLSPKSHAQQEKKKDLCNKYIRWRNFSEEVFCETINKSLKMLEKTWETKEPIPWEDISDCLLSESFKLNKKFQENYWKEINRYQELSFGLNEIEKMIASYDGLIKIKSAIEKNIKSLEKSFYQKWESIYYPVMVLNCAKRDYNKSDLEVMQQLDKEIINYLKEHGREKIGHYIKSITTVDNVDNSKIKDRIEIKYGVKIENYPADPIVFYPANQLCLVKAYRLYPVVINEKDEKKMTNDFSDQFQSCQTCKEIEGIEDIEIEEELRRELMEKVNSLKNRVLKAREIQRKYDTEQYNEYNKQKKSLEENKRKIENNIKKIEKTIFNRLKELRFTEKEIEEWKKNFKKSYFEVYKKISRRLRDNLNKQAKKINSLLENNEKMVYTLQTFIIPQDKRPPDFYKDKVGLESKTFKYLIDRMQEFRKIEVTIVENGELRFIKGKEFYTKFNKENIDEFVLIGPELTKSTLGLRQITFILGLKGKLTKQKCPEILGKEEVSFNEASKRCRPCNLPSKDQLITRLRELERGKRYWTTDTKGLYRGILVIGRKACEKLEEEMDILGRDVIYLRDGVCFTYVDPSSSASYYCVGSR